MTQDRVYVVLGRMRRLATDDPYFAEALSDYLDTILDELLSNDVFGTEGQNDPRGDQRTGEWSMERVERIDD